MLNDVTDALPKVVKDHLDAYNENNPEKFMEAFAPDALLNDAKREFLGHESIRAWADKEIFGDHVTVKVEKAYEQYGDIVVRCRVDGTFDKSKLPNPLVLTYYFSIRNEKITRLVVILNSKVV